MCDDELGEFSQKKKTTTTPNDRKQIEIAFICCQVVGTTLIRSIRTLINHQITISPRRSHLPRSRMNTLALLEIEFLTSSKHKATNIYAREKGKQRGKNTICERLMAGNAIALTQSQHAIYASVKMNVTDSMAMLNFCQTYFKCIRTVKYGLH